LITFPLFSSVFRKAADVLNVLASKGNYHESFSGTDTYKLVDLFEDEIQPIKGRDFIFHNLGAENITVTVDAKTTKTVKPYDVWNWFDGIDFERVELTNASGVEYELVIWGDYQ